MAVNVTISSQGTPMDTGYEFLTLDVYREVDRIPRAEIRVLDGETSTREFPISDSTFFVPGAEIEIAVRWDDEGATDASIFIGVVVRMGVEISERGSVLVVGLKDAAVKLTGLRKSAVFSGVTDADIISTLLTGTGVTAGTMPSTTLTHLGMVQFDCTAWDFILSRADVLGMLVVVQDATLSLVEMKVEGSATEDNTFEYGIKDIYELEMEADAEHQFGSIEATSWDPTTQKMAAAVPAADVTLAPGDLVAADLATAVGNDTLTMTHGVPVLDGELQVWADARLARSRMALMRGRIMVDGYSTPKLLDPIALAGLSTRFNGTSVITAIRHVVNRDGWRTDLQFGLSPEHFHSRPAVAAPRAAGLLPPINGLQIGKVAPFEKDETNELMVKVFLPAVDPEEKTAVWARLAAPDAGAKRGYYFRPEPKDEVVVGFLNDDPRNPVILGSLFGSVNTLPTKMGTPDADNIKRGIVTKSGIVLGFVDTADKAQAFIETPGGNKLLLEDEQGSVVLSDKNGNKITMDKNGMKFESAKKFVVSAKDAVEISGTKVDVK